MSTPESVLRIALTKELQLQLSPSLRPHPSHTRQSKRPLVWLAAAPKDMDLKLYFFAVLNTHSDFDNTVTIARIEDGDVESKKGHVQYCPVKADEVVMYLNSMGSTAFDESLKSYQRNCGRDGKTDLSKGDPYKGPKLGNIRRNSPSSARTIFIYLSTAVRCLSPS